MPTTPTPSPPRIALIGDRSADVAADGRIPALLDSCTGGGEPPECYWWATGELTGDDDLAGFDGIWVVPGSPYENPDGVIAAIATARTTAIPFLGTCGGFQHAILEFAANRCGIADPGHTETRPDAAEPLIVPLDCSLLGEEAQVMIAAGSLAASAMGAGPSTERFFCRFGLNPEYFGRLVTNGLVVSGTDPSGDARVIELTDHPFFIASLFQPELSSDPTWIHPLIEAFATVARTHATTAQPEHAR